MSERLRVTPVCELFIQKGFCGWKILAAKAVIIGDYATAAFGIVYVAAFTIAIMYIASRLFATEKILTAKFRFQKKSKHTEPKD